MSNTTAIEEVKQTLDEAAKANLETGVLLLCKEALVTAIQDRTLHRGHLCVLAAIATFISSKTAKAWPGRAAIGALLGMPVKTVSNILLELRTKGYLIADKEAVEEANNRRLTVYTFGKIDHETIRREITKYVNAMREGKVPSQRELESPAPTGQSRQDGNNSPARTGTLVPPQRELSQEVPPQRVGKSRQDGDSNSYKELKNIYRESGTCNLGHGITASADAISHPKFAISVAAVKMQAALSPDLAGVDLDLACQAAALQWAVALESGQPSDRVLPPNIVGAIIGGIRRGQYATTEHKARLAKTQGKPKLSRW